MIFLGEQAQYMLITLMVLSFLAALVVGVLLKGGDDE